MFIICKWIYESCLETLLSDFAAVLYIYICICYIFVGFAAVLYVYIYICMCYIFIDVNMYTCICIYVCELVEESEEI